MRLRVSTAGATDGRRIFGGKLVASLTLIKTSHLPSTERQSLAMDFLKTAILFYLLLMLPCDVFAQDAGIGGLSNPGFEAETVQQGWELNVYGATPRLERDTQIRHEGRGSLRISADALSDTALGQEISL